MWTPRRIALLLTGLVLFAGGYLGYARLLGSFDGLPPLPASYRPTGDRPPLPTSQGPVNSLERKFELAFGLGCPELSSTYPIRLDMEGRGILVAAQEFKIQTDADPRPGWVRLSPLSLGMIGKKRGDNGVPEINTLYCDFAFLKFDKPIRALSDMSGSKIVQAELHADPDTRTFDARRGRIRGLNNRRTLDQNDDIEMVAPGPIYYDAHPAGGRPHIYSFTTVQVFDHLNTSLPAPDRSVPRLPTVVGVGMRVFLTPEEKTKPAPKAAASRLPIPRKDPKPGLSGVDVVELDNTVEMNLWTEAGASFVSPTTDKKKDPGPKKDAVAKTDGGPKTDRMVKTDGDPKKDPPLPEKRLLTVKTDGPFRYDLRTELAHFEKPAVPKPGIVEHVTVTRASRTVGQDVLDCEYLDVQFQRTPPVPLAKGPDGKDGPAPKKDVAAKKDAPVAKKDAPVKKDAAVAGDGDLTVKSMRAWGETVVVQSDAENLYASGTEMTHDAETKLTVLKGDGVKRVTAVKDGNLLDGSEVHLFGDGAGITQAHVLGAGSIGFGDVDPKTGTYLKTASWTDRMVFSKQVEKDKPPLDVLTFIGSEGKKAVFEDKSSGQVQRIEAHQLKVWLLGQDKDAPKKADPKAPDPKAPPKAAEPKGDVTRSARPTRLEATGQVESTAPELVIKHTDYLNVWFQDVPKLIKPPEEKKDAVAAKGPADPKAMPADPKAPVAQKDAPADPKAMPADPKAVAAKKAPAAEPKKPLVVVARTMQTWVNRDPQNRLEVDRVHAEGEVDAVQAAAKAGDPDTRVLGDSVQMKTYAEGNELIVLGDDADRAAPKWGMVQNEKLTMYGFRIVVDQKTNEAHVKGEGSMQLVSASDLEGKKLEKPTPMTIYWKHKMDFYGTDKLIYYHGAVQGFQETHRVKCEWMQVLLDRPVYLNQATKPKPVIDPKVPVPELRVPDGFVGPPAPPKKADESPKVDTVMCFHAPKDDEVPRPKSPQPVLIVEEVKVNGRVVKFQSVQAPEVESVNTPRGDKVEHVMTATATETLPGLVRIWQAGQKDALADPKPDPKGGPKKDAPKAVEPPRRKGELGPDEEMKLTVVQFGEKMRAEDFRKRAKFYSNIRVVHLAADRPTIPVDLREGEIPKGAFYMECRDTLDVFTTSQKEPRAGQVVEVPYQEMIGRGNVHVRKQGEFFGDADLVTYSELKGTMTFHGTEKNPAVIYEQRGVGVKPLPHSGRIITYYTKTKQFAVTDATQINK